MTALISHTTFDAFDACAQSVFWAEVLGYADDPDDPNELGDEECMIYSPDGSTRLLFVELPDAKQGKNRVHLDLLPAVGSLAEELDRLLGLGATILADLRRNDGGWVTLADPEGNEFCLLRGKGEGVSG